MSMESDAKAAAILKMMDAFQSSSRLTDGQVDAYMEAVEEISVQAVERSCKQFRTGKVEGRNAAFIPNAVEFAINARQWDTALATLTADRELAKINRVVSYPIGQKPPPPLEALGPIKIDVGGVPRDVSHLTLAQKEEVLRTGKMPDEAPAAGVTARIQRMGE